MDGHLQNATGYLQQKKCTMKLYMVMFKFYHTYIIQILSSTHLMQLLNLNLVSRLILTFALLEIYAPE